MRRIFMSLYFLINNTLFFSKKNKIREIIENNYGVNI